MDELIGKTINRYQIIGLLGKGGMGAVVKARDLTLQRDVAMKVMHPEFARQENFQTRFLQEARSAARLDHRNIVKIFDFGQAESLLYIVMEYIPGKNLSQMLQEMRAKGQWIVLEEGVEIIRQVALAIDYAHKQGVLHRDIKPDNIMLKPEASGKLPYQPVITDLGLAKLVGGMDITQKGVSMGTPAYMSPEQTLGNPLDSRSDVYSLGILLFEIATGKLPFNPKSLPEAMQYHTQTPPPQPRSIRPDLSESLERVILKALEKQPANRYKDASSFANELEAASKAPAIVVDSGTLIEQPVSMSTQIDSYPTDLRSESVLDEFQSAPDSTRDRIQILKEDRVTETKTIPPTGVMTIGRDKSNDIVIDDTEISRKHARLEFNGEQYTIIDLNSSNGTWLDDARLLPGIPELWTSDKPVRLGDTHLRLLLAREIIGTSVDVREYKPKEPTTGTSGQTKLGVLIDRTTYSVEPGNLVSISVTLINQSPLVDHFKLNVEGIPETWLPAPTPVVQLMPGAQQEYSFIIQPPRNPKSKAGDYPIVLRYTSRDNPMNTTEVKATLTVLPYYQYTSMLNPQKIRAGRKAEVRVNNQGNSLVTFGLSMQDRALELDFKPPTAQLPVNAGQVGEAEFRAAPRHRKLFGSEQTHSMTVDVKAPTIDQPQVLTGEVVSRPLIPLWLIALLLLLCLCLIAAAALLVPPFVRDNFINPPKTAVAITATAQADRDDDGDGLTNAEEETLGTKPDDSDTDKDGLNDGDEINIFNTNPNDQDTDDDTLLDGQEVNDTKTSPTNPDTDGDGVRDNVDEAKVELPTATGTPTNTPTPTITPTPTPVPYNPCPDTYPSRIRQGDKAHISDDPPLTQRLRAEPNTQAQIIDFVPTGGQVEVIDGPECNEGWIWWKVRVIQNNKIGWVSEGGTIDDQFNYWLIPDG